MDLSPQEWMGVCLLLLLASWVPYGGRLSGQDTLEVSADNPPVWGATSLEPATRIGQLTGPPEYTFGTVGAVTVLEDQSLLVFDSQVTRLRRYDPDGSYVEDVGRDGEGPGEYRRVADIQALPAGGFAIWDPSLGRISVFSGEMTFAYGIKVRSGFHTNEPSFRADTMGLFYVRANGTSALLAGGSVADVRPQVWIQVSPEGEILDSIPIPHPDRKGAYVIASPEGRRRPFQLATVSALSPHGYQVVGHNRRYALRRPLPDGRTLQISRQWHPIPVLSEERRQWEEWTEHFTGRDRLPLEETVRIPDERPAFRELRVDDDGRIWVSPYVRALNRGPLHGKSETTPAFNWTEPPVWHVIDPNGALLGIVELPANTRWVGSRGRILWGVERGEYGEDYVTVFRIR